MSLLREDLLDQVTREAPHPRRARDGRIHMSGLQQNVHVAEEAERPQQESILQRQTAVAGPSQHQLLEIVNTSRRAMLEFLLKEGSESNLVMPASRQ